MKEDLVGKLGLTDSEVFIEPSYDPDASYANAQNADVERGGVSAMLCGNIYRGCSPAGKNTINLMVLQGYGHWERFERSYLAGDKAAYRKEKERMADVLIRKAEKALLPGLARPGERHTTAASEVVPERRLKRAGDQCVAAWMSGENLHRCQCSPAQLPGPQREPYRGEPHADACLRTRPARRAILPADAPGRPDRVRLVVD